MAVPKTIPIRAFNVVPGLVLELRLGAPCVVTQVSHGNGGQDGRSESDNGIPDETVQIEGWIANSYKVADGREHDGPMKFMIQMDYCSTVLLAGVSVQPNDLDNYDFGFDSDPEPVRMSV